jgi:hypothetical protein
MRPAALALCLGACTSGGSGTLQLSWQFADGRRCPDTGAAAISVRVGETASKDFACDQGVPPQAVAIEQVPAGGVTLGVQALSTDGAALYAGTLELDALPSAATVTLYADKMR